jgi:hypothetical protein
MLWAQWSHWQTVHTVTLTLVENKYGNISQNYFECVVFCFCSNDFCFIAKVLGPNQKVKVLGPNQNLGHKT